MRVCLFTRGGGANPSFPIFFYLKKFCCQGAWPNAPPPTKISLLVVCNLEIRLLWKQKRAEVNDTACLFLRTTTVTVYNYNKTSMHNCIHTCRMHISTQASCVLDPAISGTEYGKIHVEATQLRVEGNERIWKLINVNNYLLFLKFSCWYFKKLIIQTSEYKELTKLYCSKFPKILHFVSLIRFFMDHAELSTGPDGPAGRVGSRLCWILAGRVGSGISTLDFLVFLLKISWYLNRYESSNITFGLIDFSRYLIYNN